MSEPCPSAETLSSFIDGQLAGAAVRAIDEHVVTCSECRAVIAAVSAGPVDEGSTVAVTSGPVLEPVSTARLAEIMAKARVGETIDGAWRLTRVLGAGGMGQVFEAEHVGDGRRAALKLLRGELAQSEQVVRRFEREQQAARRIEHPAFVRVLSHGTAADGAPYFVMDLVHGPTLRALVRDGGPLPEERVKEIGAQLLDALAAAHEASVLHRDVKPENLALEHDGTVKILDFGIARITAETEAQTTAGATQTGQMLGTPGYMPPEQARAIPSEIDERVDVFATGATLVYLLTGRGIRPATGTLFEAMTQPVPKVATLAPTVSRHLARVLDRALAFDKHARFPSALAMREALVGPPRASFVSIADTAVTEVMPPPPRSARRMAIVGILVAIVAIGAALVGLRGRASPASLPLPSGPSATSAPASEAPVVPAAPSSMGVGVAPASSAPAVVPSPRPPAPRGPARPPPRPRDPLERRQ